jgi:antitoxin (DNA-binding transcriptional repressor) of toxin-antitoxin stability system
MKTFAFSKARSHLKQIVELAAKGEIVKITRNGKTIAEFHPPLEAEDACLKSVKHLKISKARHKGNTSPQF